VGRAPGSADSPLGGPELFDIYFERNMGARLNVCFGRHFAWLKYFTYQLVVPVLGPNCKQHILSPAEVSFLTLSQHAD
jgi:hypothetical protein